MQNEIRIVYAEPGKEPEIRVIPNTLEAKQALVGGYIEVVPIPSNLSLHLIVNEEGRLNNPLEPNRIVAGHRIVGPLIVATSDPDDSTEFGSFDESTAAMVRDMIATTPTWELY